MSSAFRSSKLGGLDTPPLPALAMATVGMQLRYTRSFTSFESIAWVDGLLVDATAIWLHGSLSFSQDDERQIRQTTDLTIIIGNFIGFDEL